MRQKACLIDFRLGEEKNGESEEEEEEEDEPEGEPEMEADHRKQG
jgi:hypothetical protein